MSEETKPPEQTIIDIDAFVPRTRRKIKVDGREHAVVELFDLSYKDYLKAVSLEQRLKDCGSDHGAEFEILSDVLTKVVPTISRDDLESMSLTKVGILVASVMNTFGEKADPLPQEPSA